MQTKFKRGDKVRLLIDPDPEYTEYHEDSEGNLPDTKIKKGMVGEINMLLPNGQYHIEIYDPSSKGSNKKILAYVPMAEDYLEAAE